MHVCERKIKYPLLILPFLIKVKPKLLTTVFNENDLQNGFED